MGWLIVFELYKALHINLSGLLKPTLHPLICVLHTNFVPYVELNVPQTNTGLFPLVKSARHWVWSVTYFVCGLCSTELLRSLWNHPHRQYCLLWQREARGSNWKEWLWSDALCQFDIEKNELNELKVLEGGERERSRSRGLRGWIRNGGPWEDEGVQKWDRNTSYWGIVLRKTRTQIYGQCCNWSCLSPQLSVKARCSQFGWELFHRKPPPFSSSSTL